jgi:hypothetical protein
MRTEREKVMHVYFLKSLKDNSLIDDKKFAKISDAIYHRDELDMIADAWIDSKWVETK